MGVRESGGGVGGGGGGGGNTHPNLNLDDQYRMHNYLHTNK